MPWDEHGDGTPYGFIWGPATIERFAVHDRGAPQGPWRVLRITTVDANKPLYVYISPVGRSVRVFRNHRELR